MKILNICYHGGGYGDRLLVAWVVNILNFNKIPSILNTTGIDHLVNCKNFYDFKLDQPKKDIHILRQNKNNPKFTILSDLLNFAIYHGDIKLSLDNIDIKNAPHPIIYKDIPDINGVDVAIVTKTGPWTPYRNWPYFDDLKRLLAKNNISYIDLSEEKIKNFEFLNYVKKSKIYLGLETGASVYAAPFIKDKGLIIQSGYSNFNYWAADFNYQKIENRVECAPCQKRTECHEEHKCMTKILPEKVLNLVKEKLC